MNIFYVKPNGTNLCALAFIVTAAVGCIGNSTDPTGVDQTGDELKGGTPAGGKGKQAQNHGNSAAGGSEAHGQGNEHSQAGHGSSAEHGAQAGHGQGDEHSQAGHGHQ